MDIKRLIRDIPDFPSPGIVFKDITPVLSDADALRWVVRQICDRYRGEVDAVVGIESRGFIVGAPVAYELGVGLVVARKPGKLPYATHRVSYSLEYGSDALEMHTDAFVAGERVVIVDDLLATGGTAKATVELVRKAGAEVVECAFIIELGFLSGAKALHPCTAHSLVKYD
jgi:adenine phosphoribosyltransferase